MTKTIVVVLAALILAACVPSNATYQLAPGKWSDYRDLNRSIGMGMVEAQSAPQDVKDRFAACFADYIVSAFTPAELQRLDAYARGEALSKEELDRLDQAGKDRANGTKLTNATVDRFDTTCPADVPDFKRYLNFD